jgi:hypothetical protein
MDHILSGTILRSSQRHLLVKVGLLLEIWVDLIELMQVFMIDKLNTNLK